MDYMTYPRTAAQGLLLEKTMEKLDFKKELAQLYNPRNRHGSSSRSLT
jgi:hypothetical protein